MGDAATQADWQDWLRRWDAQQAGYLPEREACFNAMFQALEVLLPPAFVALDLACGPGSLSQRLLAHFPAARCIAVDLDPVLLAVGRGALGTMDGRLRWVEADLRSADWPAVVGEERVDVALSTTALHWLPAADLLALYRRLAALIRPDGLLLNGDHMAFGAALRTFDRLARTVEERQERAAFQDGRGEDWRRWWEALRAEPGVAGLFAERERRFAWRRRDEPIPIPSLRLHTAMLQEAEFREAATIWQRLDHRVLLAVR